MPAWCTGLLTWTSAPLLRLQVIKMFAEAAGFTQAEVEQAFGLKTSLPLRQPLRPDTPSEGGAGAATATSAGARASAGATKVARAPRPSPRLRPCCAW